MPTRWRNLHKSARTQDVRRDEGIIRRAIWLLGTDGTSLLLDLTVQGASEEEVERQLEPFIRREAERRRASQ